MARELAPPRSKMRPLRSEDCIAHWTLNEIGGTAVVDQGPEESDLVSSSSSNVVDGPFYGDAGGNRGRTTTAAHATGPSTAAQRAALLSLDWCVEVWCRPAAFGGTLIIQGAAGAYGVVVQMLAGGVRVQWSAGGTVNVDSPTGLFAVGDDVHLAARRRITGLSTCDLDIEVNGVVVHTATGLARASGGSTGNWVIGAAASFGARFNGDIFEVRVAGVALDDDALRDSWARGVRDYDHATLYASGLYEVYGRALVHNGDGDWIDLSSHFGVDWIDAMEWEEGADDQGASGSLSIRREVFALSMSPWRYDSQTNLQTPLGELLRVMMQVRLEVAVVPLGTGREGLTLADWLPMFRGFAVRIDAAADPVKIDLFDLSAELQGVWVEPDRAFTPPRDRVYGTDAGTASEPELQRIIDDNTPPSGYLGGTPIIYTPVLSGVNVRTWVTASSKNVLGSLEDVVTQWGWDIRYVWDDTRQMFRFTYAEPPRSATWPVGGVEIGAGSILERARLEVSRDDIRNVVEVEYGDEDADHPGTIKRRTVLVTHSASIAKYGRRYCRIGLASDSQINDLAGATALANKVLSDLAWPLAEAEVTLPFRHHVQLHDVVMCRADEIHFDSDVTMATVGVRQRLEAGNARTMLTQRGMVSGKRWKWLELTTVARGVQSTTPPSSPTGIVAAALISGARVSWDLPKYRGSRRLRETEIHWSTTNGFTPSAATLKERLRGASGLSLGGGMVPGVPHYIRVGHIDDMGNISAWSSQVTVTPRQLPVTGNARVRRSANQALTTGSAFQTITWNLEDADPLNRHASGTYTASHSGTLRVRARALYDSASKPNSSVQLAVFVNGVQQAAGPIVLSSGSPDRAQVEVDDEVAVVVGDLVTVRISGGGNGGHAVVVGAAVTRAWFTVMTED